VQARVIGSDAYTCVPPPGFEKDPAVTAAIREFDPGVIPFWRLQAWEIDGAETVFVHHGIARHYPFPRHLRREIRFELPAGWEGPAPNFLDAVFEDQTAMAYLRGEGPGGYVPWGWNIFYWCRWQFDQLTAKVFDAILERRQAREAAAKLAWQREIEYRKKQIEPYLLKQAERLSPSDWKQLQERQHRAAVLRRLGLRPEPIREPKPFIHVRSPRAGETYGRVAPVQE
jgi:hypothetical protein